MYVKPLKVFEKARRKQEQLNANVTPKFKYEPHTSAFSVNFKVLFSVGFQLSCFWVVQLTDPGVPPACHALHLNLFALQNQPTLRGEW